MYQSEKAFMRFFDFEMTTNKKGDILIDNINIMFTMSLALFI